VLRIGPYQVERELARGGMGAVYLAQGPEGEQVAIKLILATGVADPEEARRFSREVQALEALDHPGILRVRGHGVDRGRGYMVMDLLPGQDLAAVLEQHGALPSARVVDCGRRMAAALAHAHARGIVHRDLKPANAILGPDGPVLVDFGLARLSGFDVSQLTRTGQILGTPAYMAPEQADASSEVGPATDVYGLGATLYALATGRPPFQGKSTLDVLRQVLSSAPPPPRQVVPQVDRGLERVIQRCMAHAPEERYASAAEVERALTELSAPQPARRSAAPEPMGAHRGKLLALLALPVVAALGLGLWLGLGGEPPGDASAATPEGGDSPDPGDLAEGPEDPPAPPTTAPLDPAPTTDPGGAGGLTSTLQVRALLLEAKQLLDESKSSLALETLDRALELDPDDPDVLALRGSCLTRLGRHEAALEVYDRVLEIDPDPMPTTYYNRALSKAGLGRHEQALEDYDRAIELEPDSARAHFYRAVSKASLGRHRTALPDFDRALELAPRYPEGHYNRGVCRGKLGLYREAIDDYTRALELDPGSLKPLLNRAFALARLGRHTEALEDYDRAIELEPAHPLAYHKRAVSLTRLGRYAEAIEDYDHLIEFEPSDAVACRNRGAAKAYLGRHPEALEDYARAIALDPAHPHTFFNRGRSLGALGRHAEAVADYTRAIELDPTILDAWISRGLARSELGRQAEAIDDYTRALALDPQRADAHGNRGLALGQLGRVAEAVADFTRALELDPNPRYRVNRGHAYALLGRMDEALADFDAALASGRLPPAQAAKVRKLRARAARERDRAE